MSAGASSEEGEDGFELNLAPIIDCFTVLITYLLVSASFLSLSMLEVATPQISDSQEAVPLQNTPQPVSLTLFITEKAVVRFILTGPHAKTWNVEALDQKLDEAVLSQEIEKAKSFAVLKDVTVKADRFVLYRDVAKVVEKAKLFFPTVFVGEG
jgi:biopolymer transport protein ExbD